MKHRCSISNTGYCDSLSVVVPSVMWAFVAVDGKGNTERERRQSERDRERWGELGRDRGGERERERLKR